jgi:hypothetical protein
VWIVGLLPLIGYGWAHWDRAVPLWRPEAAIAVSLAWIVLHAGALWLNAARDRDEGEVLLGGRADVPAGTTILGGATVTLAAVVNAAGGPGAFVCAAAAAVLAVLYSHPRTSWKAHPILGPMTNVFGYACLAPASGYSILETVPTWRTAAVAALLGTAVLAATFAAQVFQEQEDRARGDRTLVATHGASLTLRVARTLFAAAGVQCAGLAALGWLPWHVMAALPALVALDLHLRRWLTPSDARGGAGLVGLGLLALGSGLAGATADYLARALADVPVAGLGTPAGHPPDRPRLPPSTLVPKDLSERIRYNRPYLRVPLE